MSSVQYTPLHQSPVRTSSSSSRLGNSHCQLLPFAYPQTRSTDLALFADRLPLAFFSEHAHIDRTRSPSQFQLGTQTCAHALSARPSLCACSSLYDSSARSLSHPWRKSSASHVLPAEVRVLECGHNHHTFEKSVSAPHRSTQPEHSLASALRTVATPWGHNDLVLVRRSHHRGLSRSASCN